MQAGIMTTVTEPPDIMDTSPTTTQLQFSTTTIEEEVSTALQMFPEAYAAQIIDKYCLGLNIFLSIITNGLTILTLRRPRMRKLPIHLYMSALALVDMLFTMVGLLGRFWIIAIADYNGITTNMLLCKFWFHSFYFLESSSDWILACMSFERCLAIICPFKSKKFLTKKATFVVLTVVHVTLFGIFSNVFWLFGTTPNGRCTALDLPAADVFRQYINPLFIVYLPSAIIFLCNFAIVCVLIRARRNQTRLIQQGSESDQQHRKAAITMLMGISVMFICFKAPTEIYVASSLSRSFEYYFPTRPLARQRLLWAFVLWLTIFNHCINFFVYLISGRAFRRELKLMFQEYYATLRLRHSKDSHVCNGTSIRKQNSERHKKYIYSPSSTSFVFKVVPMNTMPDV